ncbi:uncharacterized protein LOC108667299 [Hyalella azteca]|uniref:Uncharacterized protein LOC108667299 n=1 Tax=Hyalella azteca TaxID=294128 RepID=A0A8B7N7C8_HYAAZ|nr:uncharacterized protein LOC108667299 [Hyalella azteca]
MKSSMLCLLLLVAAAAIAVNLNQEDDLVSGMAAYRVVVGDGDAGGEEARQATTTATCTGLCKIAYTQWSYFIWGNQSTTVPTSYVGFVLTAATAASPVCYCIVSGGAYP